MRPDQPLPLPPGFKDHDEYVTSLLSFSTTSSLLQTLCGGVHILDFLTRSPELYSVVLPEAWRDWFTEVDIHDVLDLLMREELATFTQSIKAETMWRGYRAPPSSLVQYIAEVRKHLLCRDFESFDARSSDAKPPKHVFMGMNPKKVHEVGHFAKYVDDLVSKLEQVENHSITHLADFGAGQNYLGRVLASKPYNRHIVAIESRSHVVAGAKTLDIHAKLTKKTMVVRNKKAYRAIMAGNSDPSLSDHTAAQGSTVDTETNDVSNGEAKQCFCTSSLEQDIIEKERSEEKKPVVEASKDGTGQVQYIEHRIKDGDLSATISCHEATPKSTVIIIIIHLLLTQQSLPPSIHHPPRNKDSHRFW
jgi:hypothetical protein